MELPPSSKSKSLLFAALDMTEADSSGRAGGLAKEMNQLKHVQLSPGEHFSPMSPPLHISVNVPHFLFLITVFNSSPEDVHVLHLLSQIMYFRR